MSSALSRRYPTPVGRAPGHGSSAQPPRGSALPPVDERLVMPETRYEILDGKVTRVPPSDEGHGTAHSRVSAILEVYVAAGYNVASDMLTRTSERDDLAPDASVYPAARDPRTGGRRLEELAFEVLHTETLGHAAKKARALVARGVRRVFAVDVERRRALTWSSPTNAWEILPPDGTIEDRALALPLPVRALVDAGRADDTMARGLLGKGNPVLAGALSAAEARGVQSGKALALLGILNARRLKASQKAQEHIRTERDGTKLDAWLAGALACESVKDLLRD